VQEKNEASGLGQQGRCVAAVISMTTSPVVRRGVRWFLTLAACKRALPSERGVSHIELGGCR